MDGAMETWLGVRGGVERDKCRGDGECCRLPVYCTSIGSKAARSTALVLSDVIGGASAAALGPPRPRGLDDMSRPSRVPSNSTVFGGSCLVASAAACKGKVNYEF